MLIVVMVAAGLSSFSHGDSSGAPGQASAPESSGLVAELKQKQDQCRESERRLASSGIRFRSGPGYVVAEYDEFLWSALEHDDKIRQALTIYCAEMPDDGHITVMIDGVHDGKVMASIVDGNYFDGD
jgi:hypothetical protein